MTNSTDGARDLCNTCGLPFEAGNGVLRQTLSNRAFAASRDADGFITAECCESCALELWDSLDDAEDRR